MSSAVIDMLDEHKQGGRRQQGQILGTRLLPHLDSGMSGLIASAGAGKIYGGKFDF